MNKISITFLFTIIVSVSFLYSQQFFYHFGQKQYLYPVENYVSISFNESITSGTKAEVSRLVAPHIKREMKCAVGREDHGISETFIYELKDHLSGSLKLELSQRIVSTSGVSSIGFAYGSGDKVIHLTTNEVIVKFRSLVSLAEVNALNSLFKTRIIEKVSLLDNTYLLAIESNGIDGKDNVFDAANKFALTSMVEYAQPNFIRYGMIDGNAFKPSPHHDYIPNDTMIADMWHIQNTGSNYPDTGISGTPGCDMNVIAAWDIATGNPNVFISIVDTGIDTNHTDLRPNLTDRTLWYDAIDNDQKPWDEYYHGTGVTGCAAGVGNNIAGVAGVAFNCRILPVRVFGPYINPYTTDLILGKGLTWAWTRGASIINCSWGGGIPAPTVTHAIQNAFHFGRSGRGTLVFGGAGNDDTDIVLYPANMEEVIGVGGLTICDRRKTKHGCDFNGIDSNQFWGASYGEGMELVAPCTFIGTTTLGGGWCICGNGTSVSSPLGAAVAALIMSKNNNLSADSVYAIICRSAVKVGNYNYNIPKKYGMWNEEMGYGRLDAKLSLDMVTGNTPTVGDQVPPLIDIFPPESGVFNSNITFTAKIFDFNGIASGGSIPKLYYYFLQNPSVRGALNGTYIGDTLYRFTFPTIPYSSGFYYYISAQDVAAPVPNVTTYPLGGKGYNPPGSTRPPKLLFVRNTNYFDSAFMSSDVPVIIPDNAFSESFSVLNNVPNRYVLDVDCQIDVAHTFIADLTISLISPSGTEIVLVSGIGWDSDSLRNTVLDDEAQINIDDSIAEPPYAGSYRPVERLWFFDGEPAGGQWKLRIIDNGFGDGGSLNSWRVKFRFATDDNVNLPSTFSLVKTYPNPFNPRTRIVFNVPRTAVVKLLLYDVTGKLVKTLLNETRTARLEDFIELDSNDPGINGGRGLASGVYFINMIADGEFIDAKRIVLLK